MKTAGIIILSNITFDSKYGGRTDKLIYILLFLPLTTQVKNMLNKLNNCWYTHVNTDSSLTRVHQPEAMPELIDILN